MLATFRGTIYSKIFLVPEPSLLVAFVTIPSKSRGTNHSCPLRMIEHARYSHLVVYIALFALIASTIKGSQFETR
jgi:hypothetical protein